MAYILVNTHKHLFFPLMLFSSTYFLQNSMKLCKFAKHKEIFVR